MNELMNNELKNVLKQNVLDKLEKNENIDRVEISNYLNTHIYQKAVLGFDIYRYSKYPQLEQALIPPLFKSLYETTIDNCITLEKFFFKDLNVSDFKNKFIDTGDGGFQIFDNPFQALIFAFYFQAGIVRYNSGHIASKDIFSIVGEINLRYSLTYDKIFFYNKNYYGPAIINCARIMSRDKLNRFLIDNNVFSWFNKEFNSIENLQVIEPKEDFKYINFLKNDFNEENYSSLIFNLEKKTILNVNVLKIGEIISKSDIISIHSLHIQIRLTSDGKDLRKYTITIGNMNSTGLNE